MKCLLYIIIALTAIYLTMDYQAYYYGLGKGFLSRKIPEKFSISILFAGSDLGNQGMIIDEADIGGVYLVCKDKPIYLGAGAKDKIMIKKVLGYYFNNEDFIVEILGYDNKVVNIQIIPKISKKDSSYIYHDLYKTTNIDKSKLKYINLDKLVLYFQYFKLVKSLSLVVLVVVILLFFKKLIMFAKSKNNISSWKIK